MNNLRILSCKFGVAALAALAALLSANASAATLARQCGAFGIVTYESIPAPAVPARILARQCGAFGIVTYDPQPVTETQTTPVPVLYAWLDAHVPGVAHESEAYEAAAMATAANGRKVWECYVVGLDPQEMDEFKISAFPMKADGTPDLANIAVDPPKSQWNVPGARAVVKGAATLDGEWKAVEEATAMEKAAMRFFKVVVEVQ